MCSFSVVTWIGNAATVLSGRWGAVSRRAQDVGCSREAMYQQARRTGGGSGTGWCPTSRGSPGRASALTRRQSPPMGAAGSSGEPRQGQATAVCGDGLGDGGEPGTDRHVIGHPSARVSRAEPGDRRAVGRSGRSSGGRYPAGVGSRLSGIGGDAVPGRDLLASGPGVGGSRTPQHGVGGRTARSRSYRGHLVRAVAEVARRGADRL